MNHVKFFIWLGAICAFIGGLWLFWDILFYADTMARAMDALFLIICGIVIFLASIVFGIIEVVVEAILQNYRDRQWRTGGSKH